MIDPKSQPIQLTIQLSYNAPVFDGDPTDAFEIADLERAEIEEDIKNYLTDVVGELKDFKLTAQPG